MNQLNINRLLNVTGGTLVVPSTCQINAAASSVRIGPGGSMTVSSNIAASGIQVYAGGTLITSAGTLSGAFSLMAGTWRFNGGTYSEQFTCVSGALITIDGYELKRRRRVALRVIMN